MSALKRIYDILEFTRLDAMSAQRINFFISSLFLSIVVISSVFYSNNKNSIFNLEQHRLKQNHREREDWDK